jgi:hypothetical protein
MRDEGKKQEEREARRERREKGGDRRGGLFGINKVHTGDHVV